MNTSFREPTDGAIALAQKKFQALQLDDALSAIQTSLEKRQLESGSDLSFYGNLLWVKILLTKGRFSKDKSFPTIALNKLLEAESLLPQTQTSTAFLPLKFLLAEAYLQLDNTNKAKEVYENILTVSRKERYEIGEIQALNGISQSFFLDKKSSQALDFANQSLELLIQHTNEQNYNELVKNYLLQSTIFLEKKDFGQAMNYADRAAKICEEHQLEELAIKAHLLYGKATIAAKEYVTGIQHLLLVKDRSIAVNHEVFLVEVILYIGVIYNEVFHYPKALENFDWITQDYQHLLNDTQQILLLNNIGKAHFHLHENEEAKRYFSHALTLAKQHQDSKALVFSLAYLGVLYARNTDYDRALIYAKRANKLADQIGDIDGLQVNLINLGNVHNKLEKYNESIKLTSRGIAAAKRMKDGLSEIRGYQIMAEIFRKKKDFKSAVMYQMIYTKFYEDFYQRNDRQKVLAIEHQYIVQQLEKKIAELEKIGTSHR